MALSRKLLSAMAIDEDKIMEIINAHTETVDGLKENLDKYKAEAKDAEKTKTELEKTKEELANAKKELAAFQDENNKSPYKKKYEDMLAEKEKIQKELDDFKSSVDAEKLSNKKSNAYRKLLKSAGVSEKRIDAIMKVTNLDDVQLDDEDNIKDGEKLSETIKEEWADFIGVQGQQGANVPKPPANNQGGDRTISRASALAAKYHANLYGESQTNTKGE